jgi:hypothetical protein
VQCLIFLQPLPPIFLLKVVAEVQSGQELDRDPELLMELLQLL